MLVIDASVGIPAALVGEWPSTMASEDLAAPTLFWSEVASGLRQLEWRREVDPDQAEAAFGWLAHAPVRAHGSRELVGEARRLAAALGWAKTYDAEYVVLAQRLGIPLVTLDARLRRAAGRIVTVVGPIEA